MLKPLKEEIYSWRTLSRYKSDKKIWSSVFLWASSIIRREIRVSLSDILFSGLIDDLMDTLKDTPKIAPFSLWTPEDE